jgi:hypothetical protein
LNIVEKISENYLANNDTPGNAQLVLLPEPGSSIKITGYADKAGDVDYFQIHNLEFDASRLKLRLSIDYSDYSIFRQPFNSNNPQVVRDIFDYEARVETLEWTNIFTTSLGEKVSSASVHGTGKTANYFYIEGDQYSQIYLKVNGFAGYEGDTRHPQQYYHVTIERLNGPVGDVHVLGSLAVSETVIADVQEITDADGILSGSGRIKWIMDNKQIASGDSLVLTSDLVFRDIWFEYHYTDLKGQQEIVVSDYFKIVNSPELENLNLIQAGNKLSLENLPVDFQGSIYLYLNNDLKSVVDNINDFAFSKSNIGSDAYVIAVTDNGDFYRSKTIKFEYFNTPATIDRVAIARDVQEVDSRGIWSESFSNRNVIDPDGMSYLKGDFTLRVEGLGDKVLSSRVTGFAGIAREVADAPLDWLVTYFNFEQIHVGRVYTVFYSFKDSRGNSEILTVATGIVTNRNDLPEGNVTISGVVMQDNALMAQHTLSDEDGLGTITYRWLSNGSNISGATGSSFTLTQAEVGKAITVIASYTDQFGTAESVMSSATALVLNVNDAPTGSVFISGAATQGQVLTASNTLADLDGLGTITYQWRSNGSNISGATGSTYTLTQAEVGKAITVVASYTDRLGSAESVVSGTSATVANVNDVPTGSVSISGTALQGQVLTASNTLANLDGLGTITYQWRSNGNNINGATGSYFTLTQAEVGKAITVVASYTDQLGTAESVVSGATKLVDNVDNAPTGSVPVSDTPSQGEDITAPETQEDLDDEGTIDSNPSSSQTEQPEIQQVAIIAPIDRIESIGISPDGKFLIIKTNGVSKTVGMDDMITFSDASSTAQALSQSMTATPVFSSFVNGQAQYVLPDAFTGPESLNLKYQLIDDTLNAVVIGSSDNDFIKLANANSAGKAVDGGGGNDVIDGGVGSTFISGGGGSNTFFLDGRAPGKSWSTITDFSIGVDKATIWGWKQGVSKVALIDELGGADGYKGLTLHFENLLPSDASITDTNSNWNSITFSGKSLSDFCVSSVEALNAQISAGNNPFFITGQTVDDFGTHGYLYIA